MKYLLYCSGLTAGVAAWGINQIAQSAVHEIEALMCVLIGAVLIAAGAVIGAMDRARTPQPTLDGGE